MVVSVITLPVNTIVNVFSLWLFSNDYYFYFHFTIPDQL